MASDDLRKSSRCLGADVLMTLLGNYSRNRDIKTAITIGIVGFPNTGKSSIINSLKRSKACSVGATPGVTKSMQVVQLDKHIKLLDSPGVVMATNMSDASIVLRNSVRLESLEDPIPAVSVVVSRCTKQQLMIHYGVPEFSNVGDFLSLLAKRYGKLKKHGLPDVNKAAKIVLQDWNTGKITYYTQPPESYTISAHLSAEIVSEMSKAFDIDTLLTQEQSTLIDLKKASSSDVVVQSDGLTAGTLATAEMEAEKSEEEYEDVESDEELENMEQDGEAATTVVKFNKVKASKPTKTKKKLSGTPAPAVLPGNMQQNKALKNAFKKVKKQRKRSDKLATQLSSALTDGLSSLGKGLSTAADDYDFSTDYK